MIKYTARAATEAEAERIAASLLLQVSKTGGESFTITTKKRGVFSYSILGEDSPEDYEKGQNCTPVVFTYRADGLKYGEDIYFLYLLFDERRLPFYATQIREKSILPLARPQVKPAEEIPVERLLTLEGAELVEDWKDSTYEIDPTPSPLEKHLETLRKAPKNLRIYAFFDTFGQSLNAVKKELESGDFDRGEADGELLLYAVTGKTHTTEKEYLKDLSEYTGAEVVQKYKKELLSGFRFYKEQRLRDYLLYELYRTEDYSYISQNYEAYASALGVNTVEKSGLSLPEKALALYLGGYNSVFYSGLTEKRLADFLKVPKETLRKIFINEDLILW